MDACAVIYTAPCSSRPGCMEIDSLLNPSSNPADRDRETDYHLTGSPSTLHTTMVSASLSSGYAYSAGYPASPGYWYPRYPDYHDVFPSAASTTTTRPSSNRNTIAKINHHHQHYHNTVLPYHTSGSTHSSSEPYHPRERYASVSSSSTNGSGQHNWRRPPRPKYEEEEMYFIWYHRVDLGEEWKEVRERFNRQFPSRQRRGFQGIQCKFYRFIKEKKCPTLREQRRMLDGGFLREGVVMGGYESGKPKFGIVEWSEGSVWYPWMRGSGDLG